MIREEQRSVNERYKRQRRHWFDLPEPRVVAREENVSTVQFVERIKFRSLEEIDRAIKTAESYLVHHVDVLKRDGEKPEECRLLTREAIEAYHGARRVKGDIEYLRGVRAKWLKDIEDSDLERIKRLAETRPAALTEVLLKLLAPSIAEAIQARRPRK